MKARKFCNHLGGSASMCERQVVLLLLRMNESSLEQYEPFTDTSFLIL